VIAQASSALGVISAQLAAQRAGRRAQLVVGQRGRAMRRPRHRVPHDRRRGHGQRLGHHLGHRHRAEHADLHRRQLDVGQQRDQLLAHDRRIDRVDRAQPLGGLLGQRGGHGQRPTAVPLAHPHVGDQPGAPRRVEPGDHQDVGRLAVAHAAQPSNAARPVTS
jgi:hypothetical protein